MNSLLHVNINAKDWKKLASFYEEVFGCKRILPEKKISGDYAKQLTGLEGSDIEGITLSFPGDEDGVELEIFQYNMQDTPEEKAINYTGLGHIAIAVDDIDGITEKLLEQGGRLVGKQVKRTYEDKPDLYIHYVKDVEGNIIELMDRKSC